MKHPPARSHAIALRTLSFDRDLRDAPRFPHGFTARVPRNTGPRSRHQPVRSACRLGKAESIAASQNNLDGRVERQTMPDADINRSNPVAGANHGPDPFADMNQRRDRSSARMRFHGIADQNALGTTETRATDQHAEMAGQSETPRMSIPLSVEQKNVRFVTELANRSQNGRRFSKAEQSGNVGKPQRSPLDDRFDHPSRKNIPHHDGSNALVTIGRKRAIRSRNQSQSIDRTRSNHAPRQLALNRGRAFR